MSHWLDKILPTIRNTTKRKNTIPEGLWRKCPKCEAVLYKPELERALNVCTKCQHHLRVNARKRADMVLDEEGREELGAQIAPVDKLKFRDSKRYKDRLNQAEKSTGEKDALVTLRGALQGQPVVVAIFEFEFMGGSMGSVVGEKFVQAANLCLEERIPLICFSASGGARMQEALFSLMQMAKTGAVLKKLKQAGIPYISVMTDPVYGGVSASLAMLGDINIAEPNALIGFAGPRVIEQTVRQKLPEGFQRSEFLLEHGVLDMIVHRQELKETLANLLSMLAYKLPTYQTLREEGVTGDGEKAEALDVQAELMESAEEQRAQSGDQRAIQSDGPAELQRASQTGSTLDKDGAASSAGDALGEEHGDNVENQLNQAPTDESASKDAPKSEVDSIDGGDGGDGGDGDGGVENSKAATDEHDPNRQNSQSSQTTATDLKTAIEKEPGTVSESAPERPPERVSEKELGLVSEKKGASSDSGTLERADQAAREPEEKRSCQ